MIWDINFRFYYDIILIFRDNLDLLISKNMNYKLLRYSLESILYQGEIK
jgi:hypothetical protein